MPLPKNPQSRIQIQAVEPQIDCGRYPAKRAIGESVAVNGACLTVVARDGDAFDFQAGPETLAKTTLGALAAGVPLGVILGRALWRLFAGNLGVVTFTVYPGWLLAAIAGGFLLASLGIAVLPARTAARAHTSQLLRAE